MNQLIAVSITAPSLEGVLMDVEQATVRGAEIIELRLDYISNLNFHTLESILPECELPVIVTNRHIDDVGKDEKGNPIGGFQGTEEERISYLIQSIEMGVKYVDIEAQHFHALEKKNTKLIVSYHDLDKTPEDLGSIYKSIADIKKTPEFPDQYNADIVKIAAKANFDEDSARMYRALFEVTKERLNYNENYPEIIGLCMGDVGRITRVIGPLAGGYLTFASLANEKSAAPGQLTLEEVREKMALMIKFAERDDDEPSFIELIQKEIVDKLKEQGKLPTVDACLLGEIKEYRKQLNI